MLKADFGPQAQVLQAYDVLVLVYARNLIGSSLDPAQSLPTPYNLLFEIGTAILRIQIPKPSQTLPNSQLSPSLPHSLPYPIYPYSSMAESGGGSGGGSGKHGEDRPRIEEIEAKGPQVDDQTINEAPTITGAGNPGSGDGGDGHAVEGGD